MHNTGGAAAMETAKADRDAFVAAKLREAGAVDPWQGQHVRVGRLDTRPSRDSRPSAASQ